MTRPRTHSNPSTAELRQRDTNNEASERTPTTLRGELEWARSANYGGDANFGKCTNEPSIVWMHTHEGSKD